MDGLSSLLSIKGVKRDQQVYEKMQQNNVDKSHGLTIHYGNQNLITLGSTF